MMTQHQRLGEDWLLKKGGFMRIIPEKPTLRSNHLQENSLLKMFNKQWRTSMLLTKCSCLIFGADYLAIDWLDVRERCQQIMTTRFDRVLRRIRRVGAMIEEVCHRRCIMSGLGFDIRALVG